MIKIHVQYVHSPQHTHAHIYTHKYTQEFPNVDFSMISDDEDPFTVDVQEDQEMCRNRAKR
jgi:hypothetical protein